MKKGNNFKRENIMPKIISLISALLLWSYVMSVEDPVIKRTYRDIPVQYLGVEDLRSRDLTIMDPGESTIDVELEGNRSYMESVLPENIQASVNLTGLNKGEHVVPIKVNNYNSNVKVIENTPTEIVFTLDENVSKEEKLEVKTVGTVPEGYILGDIKTSHEKIRISGPKSIIDKINSVLVYVDIKDRIETTVLSAPVHVYDGEMQEVKGIKVEPQNVDLELPIYKTQTVPVVLDLKGTPPAGVENDSVTVEPSSVTISGNSAVVNKIKEVKTKPVYWSNILTGQTTTVELVEPEGTKIINAKQIYTLHYEAVTISKRVFEITEPIINILHLPEGLRGEVLNSPPMIKVTMVGDEEKLSNLKAENISLSVDAKELPEGTHSIRLRTNKVEGITVTAIDPESVKCKIMK